jgi:hypothetical protein
LRQIIVARVVANGTVDPAVTRPTGSRSTPSTSASGHAAIPRRAPAAAFTPIPPATRPGVSVGDPAQLRAGPLDRPG